MLVGPDSDQYARLVGRITDVRVLRQFALPNEDYPYSKIQSLIEISGGNWPEIYRQCGESAWVEAGWLEPMC